jgi:hypothetical protein
MGLISNGSTIFDAGSMSTGFGGSLVFIKKLTASSSSTLTFVHGSSSVILDSSYKQYLFTFNNIHPSSSTSYFQVNMSTDGGSNYNVPKTTSWFQSYNAENASFQGLGFNSSRVVEQGQNYADISTTMTTNSDLSLSGTLQIFDPASTTFVKHFIARANHMTDNPASNDAFCGGYANTTSAVDTVSFRMNTGNIDAGDICLYGIA